MLRTGKEKYRVTLRGKQFCESIESRTAQEVKKAWIISSVLYIQLKQQKSIELSVSQTCDSMSGFK